MSPGVLPGELERIIDRLRATGWEDMSPDKRAFAIAYSHCGSHIEAARDIGRDGQGLRYLRDPLVRALISDMQLEIAKVSIINRSLVEQKMLETLEKLEGREAVPMVTGQGIPIEERKFHSGEVVNLLKEMGRYAGMSPEKNESGGGIKININLGSMVGEAPGVTIDNN